MSAAFATAPAFHQPADRGALVLGADTPWGGLIDIASRGACVHLVTARFGGGLFVEGPVRDALRAIGSPFGDAWWRGRAAEAAVALVADDDDPRRRGQRITAIYDERPDWLEALAALCGVPNAAQLARIQALHERFELPGRPDPAAFVREADTGMVHGWIGDRLFVGVEPCGRAHS